MRTIVHDYYIKEWAAHAYDGSWCKQLADDHQQSLFLYSDNKEKIGDYGSSSIRGCQNAFGLFTRKGPYIGRKGAFSKEEEPIVLNAIDKVFEELHSRLNQYSTIFIPVFLDKKGHKFILDEAFCKSTKRFNFAIYSLVMSRLNDLKDRSIAIY